MPNLRPFVGSLSFVIVCHCLFASQHSYKISSPQLAIKYIYHNAAQMRMVSMWLPIEGLKELNKFSSKIQIFSFHKSILLVLYSQLWTRNLNDWDYRVGNLLRAQVWWPSKSHSILECQTTEVCIVIACLFNPWFMCLNDEVDKNKTNGVGSDVDFFCWCRFTSIPWTRLHCVLLEILIWHRVSFCL